MESKELRIGNYIQLVSPYNSKCFDNIKVSEISKYGIQYEYKKGRNRFLCECKNLKPIPLTVEWVLKFGFTLSLGRIYEMIEDFPVGFKGRGLQGECTVSFQKKGIRFMYQSHYYGDNNSKDSNCKIYINYVHELQNVYSMFAKKELTVKTETT